jgi:DNA-binding FadR family transcriptional regulator
VPRKKASKHSAVSAPRAKQRRGTGRRLHGAIANWLGAAILAGKYPPGSTLSGEIEFAETLNVSRAAYREAVRVLIAKGLLESRTKSGTRVLPRERWMLLDPEVLGWAFAEEPNIEFVQNLFELRAIVEPAAAALAAARRTVAHLKTMKLALAEMTRHTLAAEAGRTADRDFHDAILRATANDALIVLSSSIGAAVKSTTMFKQRSSKLPRNPVADHRRVYEAIAASDVEGSRAAMQRLVALALEDTRISMANRPKKE